MTAVTEKTWQTQVAAIATMADVEVQYTSDYVVCTCLDGAHPRGEWCGDYRTKDAAVSRYCQVVGPKHIFQRRRMVLDELVEVTPW